MELRRALGGNKQALHDSKEARNLNFMTALPLKELRKLWWREK
jgi:hypothetical protein